MTRLAIKKHVDESRLLRLLFENGCLMIRSLYLHTTIKPEIINGKRTPLIENNHSPALNALRTAAIFSFAFASLAD